MMKIGRDDGDGDTFVGTKEDLLRLGSMEGNG
jgi:hypothetical protein